MRNERLQTVYPVLVTYVNSTVMYGCMILKTDAYLYLVNFNAIKIEKFDYNLPHNRGYVRASIDALGRNKALPFLVHEVRYGYYAYVILHLHVNYPRRNITTSSTEYTCTITSSSKLINYHQPLILTSAPAHRNYQEGLSCFLRRF